MAELNGVLAFAGDKPAGRAAALADVAVALSRGWADGDLSIVTRTVTRCGKSRVARAVAETLSAYAGIVLAERTGSRIVLSVDAPAWRVQCFLSALPAVPDGVTGKAFATLLADQWGKAQAEQWLRAVDLHVQAAADAAKAAKDKKAADAAAEPAAVAAAEPVTMAADVSVPQPSVSDLLGQVEALTIERDALRAGNEGLVALVARLKAEVQALTPELPHVVPMTPQGDYSLRERDAADAAKAAAKAVRRAKKGQAVPA